MSNPRNITEQRVLVLAPTAADATHSRSILSRAGLVCEICADLAELQAELELGVGAVLLTEELLAGAGNGLVDALQRQPPWSDVPIILLCAAGADSANATWAMETLGNVTVLERPVHAATLVSALRTAIRARERQYRLRDQMEALRASEQRFSRFMEHLPGLAWLKDSQGRYVYANQSAANAFQIPRSDLYGRTDEQLFPPETAARFRKNDRRAVGRETGLQTIEELQHADGLHISVVSKFPIPGADDGATLVGGVAIDITEQKRAEEALRRSEQQLRLVIDALPAVVTYVDRETRFRFFNRALCEWFGLKSEDVLGRTAAEVMGDDAYEEIRPRIEQAFAGQAVHYEAEVPYRHGGTRAVEVRYVPDIQSDGTVAGYVALIYDITERRNNERLRLLHTAIVESSDDAIISKKTDGTILSWNPAAERIFGYTAAEVVGRPITTIIPPELHTEEADILRRLARGEHVENYETVRVAKVGRPIDVALTISPLRNATGDIVGASKVARDITAWKQTQAALRESEERYRHLVRLLPVGVYACEASGVISFYNEQAARLWGVSPQPEDTDQRFCGSFRLWRRDGTLLPHEQTPMAVALREGREFRNESVIIERPDGSRINVLVNIDPIRDAGGEVIGAINVFHDTTQLIRALEGLRENEERLKGVVETAADAIITIDERGRIESINPAGERMFGYSAEELAGRNVCLLMPEPYHSEHDEYLANYLRTGEAKIIGIGREIVGRRKDGSVFPMELAVSEFTLGEDRHFTGIVRDITERKIADEALRQSEERFRQLATNSPAAVFVKDLEGRYTVANPLASEALGKPDGAVGCTDHDLLPAEVADELRRVDEYVMTTGAPVQNEELIRRPGYQRRFLSVKFPLFDAAGRPEGVCGVAIDVTARKRAEESLRESEERFRTLADNIAQFAWMAERLGWTAWYNKRWYDYTGTTWEEMHGRGWERVVHPDHLERVNQSLAEAARHGVPWEDVFPMRGADGGYRWFLSRAVPIRHDTGRIVRWFGTNTDITAQREAEEKLRESDRRKDEFLAMLAHELRNPLAPIRSGLDVLCYELGEKHETIQLMQEQIEHVVRLVDDLLDVSRIVRGRIELRREPVELSSIVYRAVSAVESTIESRGHDLRMLLPQGDVWLHADPVRLVQIVENLLNNAAKYTDEGGEIDLRAECRGSELFLSVRDNGIGIEPELMPRVFELFTQSSRSLDRSQGGLGIGLTLVRNLVELHGGSISVTSAGSDQGSEFTVRLPVADPPLKSNESAAEPPATAAPRRILVVDDNHAAAKMLALLLAKQNGHQIETVHDGRAAVESVHSFHPDVVLLDIGLPGMDGYEVARTIRSSGEGEDVLLVALTGYGQREDIERSKAAGFDEHLVKPPALDALQRLLVHPRLKKSEVGGQRSEVGKKPKFRQPPTSGIRLPPSPADNGDHEQLRTAVHELGNLAHAIRIAAHILKTTNDPGNVQTVQEILEDLDGSMAALGQSLRNLIPATESAEPARDEAPTRSPSGL
jgi:PAS domain S-box-containing protein